LWRRKTIHAEGASDAARINILQQHEGWLDALVLVSTEVLRHGQTLARAQRAEQSVKSLERQAALAATCWTSGTRLTTRSLRPGKLRVAAARTGFALGSITLTDRDHPEHGVRMHEILQRFSSIEKN